MPRGTETPITYTIEPALGVMHRMGLGDRRELLPARIANALDITSHSKIPVAELDMPEEYWEMMRSLQPDLFALYDRIYDARHGEVNAVGMRTFLYVGATELPMNGEAGQMPVTTAVDLMHLGIVSQPQDTRVILPLCYTNAVLPLSLRLQMGRGQSS